jgi:magnesium transporter
MNFQFMPELASPYGYPAAIGMMAVIGSLLVFYFRKIGWW